MADVYSKESDWELRVTGERTEIYSYNLLKRKKAFLELELSKINLLIEEADKLGIVEQTPLPPRNP